MIIPASAGQLFSGRSQRKEYWMFILLFVIVYAVFMGLMLAGGFALDGAGGSEPGALSIVGIILLVLFHLASIIPSIAVQVRRFHDQDRSGWFVLLGFIPYIGSLIVIVFMCLDGTPGLNRFGPDPKDRGNADVFA